MLYSAIKRLTHLRRRFPRRSLVRILHLRPPHFHPPPLRHHRLHFRPFWIFWLTRVSSPKMATNKRNVISLSSLCGKFSIMAKLFKFISCDENILLSLFLWKRTRARLHMNSSFHVFHKKRQNSMMRGNKTNNFPFLYHSSPIKHSTLENNSGKHNRNVPVLCLCCKTTKEEKNLEFIDYCVGYTFFREEIAPLKPFV